MTSKQFSPEWCEAAAAEIERQREDVECYKGMKEGAIIRVTILEEQLKEAREAAKLIVARLHNNGDKDGAAKFERRYPWLEEDQ